jgi:hypothetical protein
MIHLPEEFFDGIKLAASRWKQILAMKRMGIVVPTAVDSENILSRGAAHSAYKKLREIVGKGGKVLRQEGKGLDLIPPTIKRRADAMKRFSDKTRSEVGSSWKGGGDIPEKQEFVRGTPGRGSLSLNMKTSFMPRRLQDKYRFLASKYGYPHPKLVKFMNKNLSKSEKKGLSTATDDAFYNNSTLHGHDKSVASPKVLKHLSAPMSRARLALAENRFRTAKIFSPVEHENLRLTSSTRPSVRLGLPSYGDVGIVILGGDRNTKHYISSKGSKRFSVSKLVGPKRLPGKHNLDKVNVSIGMVETGNPKATSLKSLKTVKNPPKPKLPGTLGANLNP